MEQVVRIVAQRLPGPEDVAAFLAQGFTERHILEIILAIAGLPRFSTMSPVKGVCSTKVTFFFDVVRERIRVFQRRVPHTRRTIAHNSRSTANVTREHHRQGLQRGNSRQREGRRGERRRKGRSGAGAPRGKGQTP
jgi:hypothetical protein